VLVMTLMMVIVCYVIGTAGDLGHDNSWEKCLVKLF
jgi:hypothetical protein